MTEFLISFCVLVAIHLPLLSTRLSSYESGLLQTRTAHCSSVFCGNETKKKSDMSAPIRVGRGGAGNFYGGEEVKRQHEAAEKQPQLVNEVRFG